jgi:hypothetical protein
MPSRLGLAADWSRYWNRHAREQDVPAWFRAMTAGADGGDSFVYFLGATASSDGGASGGDGGGGAGGGGGSGAD